MTLNGSIAVILHYYTDPNNVKLILIKARP